VYAHSSLLCGLSPLLATWRDSLPPHKDLVITVEVRLFSPTLECRVSDPIVDPAFFLIADPGFDDLKFKTIYSWKFNFYFLDQKFQFTFP
jgi:hypothetical protein